MINFDCRFHSIINIDLLNIMNTVSNTINVFYEIPNLCNKHSYNVHIFVGSHHPSKNSVLVSTCKSETFSQLWILSENIILFIITLNQCLSLIKVSSHTL